MMINNRNWDQLQVTIRTQIIQTLLNNHFHSSMPVQEAAIPLLLKNYDLAVQAQTGSGKTLAFLIPLLQKYLAMNLEQKRVIKYVILSPTRELCQQTFNVLEKLICKLPDKEKSQKYGSFIKCVTGGNEIRDDVKKIENSAFVLIGTVGRLKQLCNLFEQNWLKKVDYLYIDEADRVLKEKGIKQLLKMFQKVRRTAMFSATLQSLKQEDYELYGMRNLAKISLKSMNKADGKKLRKQEEKLNYVIPKNLNNIYITMRNRLEKINFLLSFLIENVEKSKIIVFFNTCASVDFYTKLISDFLTKENEEIINRIYGMHGKLKNKKRNKILNSFTEKDSGCLFATDVVSRGIDFDHIHYIIQVDPPEDPDNYIHRIGRTARVNNSGTAILLIENHEDSFIQYLQNKQVGVKEEKVDDSSLQNRYEGKIMQMMLSDRDFIEKSKKGFVSYIRSYKEHDLKYIFEFKNVDIGYTAKSFFLFRIPRVKQILGRKIQNFDQSEINVEEIPWKDRNQELQFHLKRQRAEKTLQSREKKKDIMNIKNNKSKRKRVKAKRQNKMLSQMNEEYRQIKKSKRRTNRQIQQSDLDEDTEEIERRLKQRFPS